MERSGPLRVYDLRCASVELPERHLIGSRLHACAGHLPSSSSLPRLRSGGVSARGGMHAGLVLQPLPVGATAFIGLTVTVATKTLPFLGAFAAFRNEVIWLIVVSFYFAKGFEKCGLGDRIANLFVRVMGKSTLGLAYGLTLAEGIIAPAMPSTSARAGGIFMPIIKSLSEAAGSTPGATSKKLGSFLVFTIMHVRSAHSGHPWHSRQPQPLSRPPSPAQACAAAASHTRARCTACMRVTARGANRRRRTQERKRTQQQRAHTTACSERRRACAGR
jgi:Sodium:sulfate symporter transmembrane region